MNKKSSDFIKCLAGPVFAFLVQQGISILYMEVYLGYKLAVFPGGDYMDYVVSIGESIMNPDNLGLMSLFYAVICTIWFSVWYYRLKYNVKKDNGSSASVVRDRAVEVVDRQRGLFEGYSWMIIPGIIILVCGGQVVCEYLTEFVGSLVPSWYEFYEELMKTMGLTDDSKMGLFIILYALFLGPICEELTFRGLCFNYARRSMSFLATNIISSLAFAIMHLNPLQGLYAFLFGLVLGAVYEKSRNIFVTMAIHVAFNSSAFIVSPVFGWGDTPFKYFVILLCSLLMTYVGYELVIKAIPKHIDIEIR